MGRGAKYTSLIGAIALLSCPSDALEPQINSIVAAQFKRFRPTTCSGLINGKLIGCTSDRSQPARGVLRTLNDEAELNEFLASTDESDTAVALKDGIFTKENLDKLAASEKVTSVSVLETTNNPVDAATLQGLNEATFDFPVTFLSRNNTGLVDSASSENDRIGFDAKQANRLFIGPDGTYMGPLDGTTDVCLSLFRCDPIGGYSVYGTVGASASDRDIVMMAAPMDSNAFFKDLSYGANTAASGYIALLLASSAFRNVREEVAALPKQIVLSLFEGEQFDRMGSAKFVSDISNGCSEYRFNTTDSCMNPPTYSVAWENFQNATISSVVVVEQVLGESLYVHNAADAVNAATAAVEGKLLEVAATVDGVSLADGVETVPASSTLNSFLPVMDGGVLVSGSATGQNSAEYNTHLDRFYGSPEETKATAARLARLAEVLARSAVELAAEGAEVPFLEAISVDDETAESLTDCMLNNFACDMVAGYLNVTVADVRSFLGFGPIAVGDPDAPAPLYTGIYVPFRGERGFNKAVERFARMFMTDHISPVVETAQVRCGADADCYAVEDCAALIGALNTAGTCHLGTCTCSSVALHDAYALGLEFNTATRRFSVTPGTDLPTWAEPVWGFLDVYVYRAPDFEVQIGLLVGGIVSAGLTWFGLRKLLASENPKLKML